MPPPRPRRIHIHGCSGSGKSTLGKRLSAVLCVPSIELDALYHLPNWGEPPKLEFMEKVAAAVDCDAWVVDGNYGAVRQITWPRADTIVFLDYPFALVLLRVVNRTVRRLIRREVLWAGNREQVFRTFFTRESIIWWMMTTWRKRRRDAIAAVASPALAGKTVLRFRSPRETEAWVRRLELEMERSIISGVY